MEQLGSRPAERTVFSLGNTSCSFDTRNAISGMSQLLGGRIAHADGCLKARGKHGRHTLRSRFVQRKLGDGQRIWLALPRCFADIARMFLLWHWCLEQLGSSAMSCRQHSPSTRLVSGIPARPNMTIPHHDTYSGHPTTRQIRDRCPSERAGRSRYTSVMELGDPEACFRTLGGRR